MYYLLKTKSKWIPPLLFLVVLTSAFGLLIPKLGFYWDDWPPILIEKMQDTSMFWKFYQYDRPFSAWTYVTLFPVLGTKPLTWQIFTLGIRWLTTVFVWLSLREIWPTHRKQAVWVAVLFALYPSFDQDKNTTGQKTFSYAFRVAFPWRWSKPCARMPLIMQFFLISWRSYSYGRWNTLPRSSCCDRSSF